MGWSASLKILPIFFILWSLTSTLESEDLESSKIEDPFKEIADVSEDGRKTSNSTEAVEFDEPFEKEFSANFTDGEHSNSLSYNVTNDELHDMSVVNVTDPSIIWSFNETTLPFNDTTDAIYDDDTEVEKYGNKSSLFPEFLEPVVKEVKSEYDILEANLSSDRDVHHSTPLNGSMRMSGSTISWLEAFMYQHRDSYWMAFNMIFMITWIVVGLFSLYRLFGLPLCSSLLSRTFYLVIHLMIFTAATFSVVHLLHLCFGSHEGLPLFLTLLLTHTPVPCLATCCILVSYCIFLGSRVPIFGSFLPSFTNLSVFVSSLIAASLLGDIIVGISHSSAILIIFRSIINCLCIGAFLLFSFRYKKIRHVARLLRREFSGEFKSLVIPLNTPNRDLSMEVKNKLKDILIMWSTFVLIASVAGIVMCLSSLFLSLFFTVSSLPLWLFWALHSSLFLSQVTVIISLTLSAALTLVNTSSQNLLVKYFVVAFPSEDNRCGSFIKHGNFIYQRVSFSNMPPTCANNSSEEFSSIKNNQVIMELPCSDPQPRVKLRRAVTFNCGPQEDRIPYYSKNKLNPILSENCIACSDYDRCHCNLKDLNNSRCYNCMPQRSSRCYESDEKDTPYAYCGKYPRKNYYGRGKSNSFRNLSNCTPQSDVEEALKSIKLATTPLNEIPLSAKPPRSPKSPKLDPPPSLSSSNDKECVKEIILENQQLFNPLMRKQSTKEQVSPRPSREPKSKPTTPLQEKKLEDIAPSSITPENSSPQPKGVESSPPLLPQKYSPPSKFALNANNVSPVENNSLETNAHPSNHEENVEIPAKNNSTNNIKEQNDKLSKTEENKYTQSPESTGQNDANHKLTEPNKLNSLNADYDSFTLPNPKRLSLKRNHSSAGDFTSNAQAKPTDPDNYSTVSLSNSKLKYPWYGTWGGRRHKKRPNLHDSTEGGLNVGLRRLSGSKGSLSSLYGKLKPKRSKASVTPTEHIALDNQLPFEENPQVKVEEEIEEALPARISQDIDLASEIFKSSRLLAKFYALEESEMEEREEEASQMNQAGDQIGSEDAPNNGCPPSIGEMAPHTDDMKDVT